MLEELSPTRNPSSKRGARVAQPRVVRALASHQCGPGFTPGVDAICGLSLLLVLSFAPRGFSPGAPVFPSPQKPTTSSPGRFSLALEVEKNQHFQIPIRSGTYGHVLTSSYELLCASWVNKQFTFLQRNSKILFQWSDL